MNGDSIPGKLRARPVQHPATPALTTAEEESMVMVQTGYVTSKQQLHI